MKNFWIFSITGMLIFGCNARHTENAAETESRMEEVSASSTYTTEKFVYVNTAENTSLAKIQLIGEEIDITTSELNLFGTLKEDKRKYYDQNNAHLYSVKYKDDGFKLRDAGENLLWKIKFYEDKSDRRSD